MRRARQMFGFRTLDEDTAAAFEQPSNGQPAYEVSTPHLGGGAYWAGRAAVRPLFSPNG